ncbi:GNAT family N-acetyltransferase [Geodermatophilus sp. DSM 44513]|uniref:GNAT family N-acetyltransferase n=1 Tax=Geodermatophilus sp. DSM 44513 TaxID=1528104 RepID=UPI0012887BA5|nr:GNAT family N-acetyltransferase [Geodermatophilus sp. DSM 44513]WNV74743.1 GNAT family N-acetyltransferase [Geodermatophilus sp. DSM 44513]
MALDLSAVDLTTEVVHTERLVLRPYREEDVDAVVRACQDEGIQRWIAAIPSPYTRAAALEFLTVVAPAARAGARELVCAVEADGVLVGSSGLHHLHDAARLGPEIGYWTAPWARGRGYAAEAAAALAEWAFAHGAPRVHLYADVGNTASQAVARRAGFTAEGVVRSCLEHRDGGRGDAVLFGRVR